MASPIVFSYEFTTRAPIDAAWREVSDTDRFNRAIGTGFQFERAPDGTTRGSFKKLGIGVTWEEMPFSYRAPRWFRIERAFETGPAALVVARAELTPLPDGGTHIAYRVDATPRGLIASAMLRVDFQTGLKPRIGRALRDIVAALDADASLDDLGGPAPQLSPTGEENLRRAMRQLTPSGAVDRLASFLRAGPLRDQARMSPQLLARAWNEQLDDTLVLLFRAVEAGMLAVRLDLLCPACLVPRQVFTGEASLVHCEACNIQYDANFPENLAVHFRPSPQIREFDVRIDCIGSPGETRHIVAQERLEPGQECDLVTDFKGGMHRVRTLPTYGPPALLEMVDGGGARDAAFRCSTMIHPQYARLSAPKSLLFRNETNAPLVVVVERLERPPQIVTAGRLVAEFPQFRSLAPVLPFFSSVELYRATAIAVTFVDGMEAALGKLARARIAYGADQCLLAVYASLREALDDLKALGLLQGRQDVRAFAGISFGTTFEQTRGSRRVPMGTSVDDAYAAMTASGLGAVTCTAAFAATREATRDIEAAALTMTPHPYRTATGGALVRIEAS